MSLSSFLKLVEIQTKVASFIPFLLGTVYAAYRFEHLNTKNFLLMLISLLTFDMVTTATNNYFDYKKAYKTYGYNYETHNAIVKDQLKERNVIITIAFLLFIAIVSGILLYLNTNSIVLILGALSFIVGILYSFGPIPISRMPLGEVSSGLLMGFVIVFLSIYIHVYDQSMISLLYEKGMFGLKVNILEVVYIFLLSIPTVNGIANIMLANNICDMEDDIINKRYTLPIYVGKEKALRIFKSLYYMIYFSIVLLVGLKGIPVFSLLTLITFIPVKKNIQLFYKKQTKKDTFVLAVKNFVMITTIYVLTILLPFLFL